MRRVCTTQVFWLALEDEVVLGEDVVAFQLDGELVVEVRVGIPLQEDVPGTTGANMNPADLAWRIEAVGADEHEILVAGLGGVRINLHEGDLVSSAEVRDRVSVRVL